VTCFSLTPLVQEQTSLLNLVKFGRAIAGGEVGHLTALYYSKGNITQMTTNVIFLQSGNKVGLNKETGSAEGRQRSVGLKKQTDGQTDKQISNK
jgi:hypothetical protein